MTSSVTIGREQGNDIVIPGADISNRHALLYLEDDKSMTFRIEDLESTSGVFKNGQKIQTAEFCLSDHITLANVTLNPTHFLPVFYDLKHKYGNRKKHLKRYFLAASELAILILILFFLLYKPFVSALVTTKTDGIILLFAAINTILITVYLVSEIFNFHTERKLHTTHIKETPAWKGYRKFEISRIEKECAGISNFYLAAHDNKPIPSFLPGQYMTFKIHVPGQDKPVIRCYSLSDRYHPEYYRISVKKMLAPADQPELSEGICSSYLIDQMRENTIVDVQSPAGKFFLDMGKQSALVFIGCGIGITPMISMLNSLVASASKREVWLLFGFRNSAEQPMKNDVAEIVGMYENVHLRIWYSNPLPQDNQDQDYNFKGRLNFSQIKEVLPSNHYEYYICGPLPMMMATHEGLLEWGVKEEDIYVEAFESAHIKPSSDPSESGIFDCATEATVTFARSCKSFQWKPENGSLLDFAEDHGIDIESGCQSGNCSTCLVAIHKGQVCYTSDHDIEPESGSCLTCICVPKTDLILDA